MINHSLLLIMTSLTNNSMIEKKSIGCGLKDRLGQLLSTALNQAPQWDLTAPRLGFELFSSDFKPCQSGD
jgi:hypothetical protein